MRRKFGVGGVYQATLPVQGVSAMRSRISSDYPKIDRRHGGTNRSPISGTSRQTDGSLLTMLANHDWKLKYTPEDGDLVKLFYIPALEDAERYDRLTGYFNAGALALAARGIEGLVRNEGRMRLVVGCTLNQDEIDAIEKGEALRKQLEIHLTDMPLVAPDADTREALELVSWMVAKGYLEVKVAVPCDKDRNPVRDNALFHEKSGIIEDRGGDRIAWTGSLNETAAGWRRNWETINVFTSWGPERSRVDTEERNFARLWASQASTVIVIDVPEAVRRDLLRFMPSDGPPARLSRAGLEPDKADDGKKSDRIGSEPRPEGAGRLDWRARVWAFIGNAARLSGGGALVGEATAAVTPWPHQVRAFEKLYGRWPPKLLIADEVGLGKTIQAGMLLRQAWLSRRAKRILIMAPKAVLSQWQIELREKFNLNWPIYNGRKLVRYPSPALRGQHQQEVERSEWHHEPVVITSSHLMRRRDRAAALLEHAEPWDLVVLDEAHHARRRGAGGRQEGGPNALLRLMRALKAKTEGLVLLTATPMQVHAIEVWDLLDLLGLPDEWTAQTFLAFFDDVNHPNPSAEAMERMARLFQATEREHGRMPAETVQRMTRLTKLRTRRVIQALRDPSSIPRRRLENKERRAAVGLMRAYTPLRHLISRHTRELLRRYAREGMLDTSIAERQVDDHFVEMSEAERQLYEAVEAYIRTTYNQAGAAERAAVGFVMTTYRRRLASSVHALRVTLERHRAAIEGDGTLDPGALEDDVPDDETADEVLDTEELAALERRALASEERQDIDVILAQIARCPPDSKLEQLKATIAALRDGGYEQVMVFTQYGDTMDFLRERLRKDKGLRLMCYSGRGGEVPTEQDTWRTITRDDTKRRFRLGEADVLLCTDAAAEGLNFQFCGALVNYDMPWNPMRVEQRIGRVDRLGQRYPVVRISNLHYEDTVETDVYRALGSRINLFQTVVGPLQPILASLPGTIRSNVLADPRGSESSDRATLREGIERQIDEGGSGGFDIDAVLEEDWSMPERPAPAMTMDDLDRVIAGEGLMPQGTQVRALGPREYALRPMGRSEELRVTTSSDFYEEHTESVEFWSPGNPVFSPPDAMERWDDGRVEKQLGELLDRQEGPARHEAVGQVERR